MRNMESAPASSLPPVSETADDLNELFAQPSATNEERQTNQIDREQPANYEEPKSSNFYDSTASIISVNAERAVAILNKFSEGAADRKEARQEMADKAKGVIRKIGRSALAKGAAVLSRTTESVKISYELTKDTMAISRDKISSLAEDARVRTQERRERRQAQRAAANTETAYDNSAKYEQPQTDNEENEDAGLDIFNTVEDNARETWSDRRERKKEQRRAEVLALCEKARARKKARREFISGIMTKAPEKTGNLYRTAKAGVKRLGRAALNVAKRAVAAGSAAVSAGAATWEATK